MACIPKIALCGGLIIGVDIKEPNTPPLVMVKLPPVKSSTVNLPSRPFSASDLICFSISAMLSLSQLRNTGVTKPRGVETAMLISK